MIRPIHPQWTAMERLWRPMAVGHSPHTQMKLRILRYKRACTENTKFHLGALLIAYAKYFGMKSVSISPA